MTMVDKGPDALFNTAIAALLAAASAFFVFAMPDAIFADLSGGLLSGADPALAWAARGAAMGAIAVLGFLLVRALFSRIDRHSDPALAAPEEAVAPRLRRADAHPDAPARRPLFAEEELGEPQEEAAAPAEPARVADITPAESSGDPIPAFLVAAAPADAEAEPEPEPESESEAEAEPETASEDAIAPPPAETARESETAPLAAAVPPHEQVAEPYEIAPPPEPEELCPEEARQEESGREEIESATTEQLMARLPLPEDSGADVASLFRRLDAGLATCEWPLKPPPQGEPNGAAPAPRPEPEPEDAVGEQLRSALDELRRMAGGAG